MSTPPRPSLGATCTSNSSSPNNSYAYNSGSSTSPANCGAIASSFGPYLFLDGISDTDFIAINKMVDGSSESDGVNGNNANYHDEKICGKIRKGGARMYYVISLYRDF